VGRDAETRYVRTPDGLHIAYQVVGDGSTDLVFIPGWLSHDVEAQWDQPLLAHSLRRMAAFSRLIVFDQRGAGLSDPVPLANLPTLEELGADVLAVLDAVGSKRAVIFGTHQGGPIAIAFAATFPSRVANLVLVNTFARLARARDYPVGVPEELLEARLRERNEQWGVKLDTRGFNPSLVDEEGTREAGLRSERVCASPGTARALRRAGFFFDVRSMLPMISAPTLVVHRADVEEFRVGHGQYLAQQIPDVKYVELPGADSSFYVGDADSLLDEVEEFVTGTRACPEPDRVLTTVLFTDVAGSTARPPSPGSRGRRDLLDECGGVARRQLECYGSRIVKTTGEGLLATFDGPADGINCARSIRDALGAFGLVTRSGLHSGEVEVRGTDLSGIAVNLAHRVQETAAPGEVLVSRTVVDLVAGSGLEFDDRDDHNLNGVPGRWRLFAVEG
jgi:pimeloyl-ACP methyl ester carboxylesterase